MEMKKRNLFGNAFKSQRLERLSLHQRKSPAIQAR